MVFDKKITDEINRLGIKTVAYMPRNPRFKNLTGQKFGRLSPIQYLGTDKHYNGYWLCQCDCGNILPVRTNSLTTGKSKSCGCYRNDNNRSNVIDRNSNFKHGLVNSSLYHSYDNMIQRCYNPNREDYYLYGGRNITVCDEWKDDINSFFEWAFENGYDSKHRPKLSLDRKDPNGNYEPSNCRWCTNKEQQNNRRNNRLFTYAHYKFTASQWAEITGINSLTIIARVDRGWSVEDALTIPTGKNDKGNREIISVPEYMLQYNKYDESVDGPWMEDINKLPTSEEIMSIFRYFNV
jgi:hypothetical protein